MLIFLTILKFISLVIFVICFFSYINCVIVDIGSAIASARTLSPTGADDAEQAKKYATFRVNLSIIMGITLAILICL